MVTTRAFASPSSPTGSPVPVHRTSSTTSRTLPTHQVCPPPPHLNTVAHHAPASTPRASALTEFGGGGVVVVGSPQCAPSSEASSLKLTGLLGPPVATAFNTSKRVLRGGGGRRPLLLLYLIGALVLLSHAFTLHLTIATFVARPRGRADLLPFHSLRLLRRHAAIVAGGRRVAVVSASTQHYATHVRNLVCTVRATVGVSPVFFALDTGMLHLAHKEGIPVIDARPPHSRRRGRQRGGNNTSALNASEVPYKFATPEFNYVSRLKLRAVRDALLAGVDVLFTDVDVVFCADAATALVERSRVTPWASVLIQNGRSLDWQWPVEPNTGFFYVKHGADTIALFDHLAEMIERPVVAGLCDQFVFKRQVCEAHNGDGEAVRNDSVVGRSLHFCQWQKGRVGVEILPLDSFPNGHRPLGVGFNGLEPGQLREACLKKKIVVFHNNYCDARRKVERMDRQGLWSVRRCDGKCQPMGADEYSA